MEQQDCLVVEEIRLKFLFPFLVALMDEILEVRYGPLEESLMLPLVRFLKINFGQAGMIMDVIPACNIYLRKCIYRLILR